MLIKRIETTIIPQSLAGKKFAEEYAIRLKEQNALREYKEYTTSISITAEYHLELKEGEDKE